MFDVALIAICELQYHMAEEQAFQERLATMTFDERVIALQLRKEERKERTIERRHQELCRAIRDSRPSGLGIFW